MADNEAVQLNDDDAARMIALKEEIQERLAEMAAIFCAATGAPMPGEEQLTYRPLKYHAEAHPEDQTSEGERPVNPRYIELICDPNGTCGCTVYWPNGHVTSEWPCGG